MTYPIPADAAKRPLVRLADGRVGRLIGIGRKPTPGRRGRGKHANVLVAGRYVRCQPQSLTIIDEEEQP